MAHEWDSGIMVRQPSWHRMEKAVLPESPRTWEEARTLAGLDWEVETREVSVNDFTADHDMEGETFEATGYQAIIRNDKPLGDIDRLLSIQKDTYKVITNSVFGDVIDTVLDRDKDDSEDPLNFEALFSLYGGRQIVALCYFDKPLEMSWDPSANYSYLALVSRHDGQGGLRGLPTNVRVQCANTLNMAEAMDGRNVGFSIRHTSSWEERLMEVGMGIRAARGESARWLKFSEALAGWSVSNRARENYLRKFLPISDADGKQKSDNTVIARDKIRTILESETCTGIDKTGYGLLMASTEWSDHFRGWNSTDSYVARQLLMKQEPKARSARILREMASIKV